MRKLVMSLAMVLGMTSTASADYTFVVPQKPGGGTTVWTEIVAKEPVSYTHLTLPTTPYV